MSSSIQALTKGVWTQITTSEKNGSVFQLLGDSVVIYTEAIEQPVGHDQDTPTALTTNYRETFKFSRIPLTSRLWAYAVNDDVKLTVTPESADVSSTSAIALGLVGGVEPEVKFGHCPAATAAPTDVWELGATVPVYIFPDYAGESVTIESTEGADTQLIAIDLLDVNGIEERVNINLTGDTPLAIPGTFTAVNRAFNDDSALVVGDIIIKGAVSGNIFAFIDAREQQTTQCIYVVPSNKYCLIKNVSTSLNSSTNQDAAAIVTFLVQEPGGVFRTQIRYGLQKRGTSNISSDLISPALYPPGSRIKISMTPDTTGMDISSEFSSELYDVGLFQ